MTSRLNLAMATATPLTEQDIDSLQDVIQSMLQQYGVSTEGLKGVEDAKMRLRRKLLEDSGRRIRKPGEAAEMMKTELQRDRENRQELLQLCEAAQTLLMTTLEPDVRNNLDTVFGDTNEILARCRNQLVKDDCPILVAGETSSGKSTLLNVLLGENILPSTLLCKTSVICEIKYGTTKKVVVHLNEPDPKTGENFRTLPLDGPTEANLKKISQYVHLEGKARETASNCKKVEIYWPLPLLEGGIFIVDSPGVGESEKMDEHVSNYISNAFAFIYVINIANAGGVQPGRLPKLLELCRRAGPQDLQLFDPKAAIFVCNKWDQVPDQEEENVKQDTLHKLRQHWPLLDDSQLFCLSALKAQKAGYVTNDLDRLLDGIDALLPQSLRHKVTVQYSWIRTLLKEATKVVQAQLSNATRPIECLEKLKIAIPKIQEADKQMIKAIEKESRSPEELLKLYSPQYKECSALLGKLALFNLRRLRKIEYDLDELLASMLQKIGSGGFGIVHKVQIKRQGSLKQAALKIAKEPITEENVIEFHNEEECLRFLKDPHIVDYYGLAAAPHPESGGLRLGVLMEYCPYTLYSWLNGHKERTPAWWPEDEAKKKTGFSTVQDLALQLCLGLKAMHEKRFMHRDLKLANVLVTEEGVVKIADLGFAKHLEEELTDTPVGTVLYAAPEVFRGREHYDISADIYSLGFCLLEMWYGMSVTEDINIKEYLLKVLSTGTQKSVTPPTKLSIPNTLPPCSGWVDLMKGCWKKDPKSRPSSGVCVQLMTKMKL